MSKHVPTNANTPAIEQAFADAKPEKNELSQHPLSAAFPAMNSQELEVLSSDIAVNGLREPIALFEGQVVDGWHRLRACKMAGVEAETYMYRGLDPIAFVISKNGHRRHLTQAQKAQAISKATSWRQNGSNQHAGSAPGAEAPESTGSAKLAAPPKPTATAAQMAKMAGVGERSIERAKTIESAGLGDEVRDGKIGATKSAEIAKQGPEAVAKAKAAMAQGQPVEAPAPKPKASKPASGDTESALEAVREELAKVKAEFEDYVENAQETVSLLEDADAELQMLRRIVEAVAQTRPLMHLLSSKPYSSLKGNRN